MKKLSVLSRLIITKIDKDFMAVLEGDRSLSYVNNSGLRSERHPPALSSQMLAKDAWRRGNYKD